MGNLCAKDNTDHTATSPLSANANSKKGCTSTGTAAAGGGGAKLSKKTTQFSYQLVSPSQPKYEASRDPNDYACTGLTPGATWLRLPGQINDQRINIETARGSTFILLDQCDSVQIDDAVDCTFFIGPTTGAVFIRDCKNCKFVVLCGQLRLRDTHNSTFALYCRSRPVIESSTKIGIGCYSAPQYIELRSQMAKAGLSVWTNLWFQVHDFTPKAGNWHPLSAADAAAVMPSLAAFCQGEVTVEEERVARIVPTVLGHVGGVTDEKALTTFVSVPGASEDVESFFLADTPDSGHTWALIETGEVKLSSDTCAALTAVTGFAQFAAGQVVIVIVVNGLANSVPQPAWAAISENGTKGRQLRDCLLGNAGSDSGFGHAL